VELLFSTHIGSVLAMAELLSPCSSAPIGLQPFRFVAMDSTELRKLRAAIASSQKTDFRRTPTTLSRSPSVVSEATAEEKLVASSELRGGRF
jgi:hypothetical protein